MKIKSWHKGGAILFKMIRSLEGDFLITVGHDFSITYWKFNNLKDELEYITPSINCNCIEFRDFDNILIASYSDGYIWFFKE